MPRRLASLVPYALSFYTSASLMTLELVASRLVARHVGASLIVWTSVIGVILAGICLGNVLGGRLADRVDPRRILGPLYAVGAALTAAILGLNGLVGLMPGLEILPWNARTLVVVALDFLVPATVLGMISPVVAKMAVEQAKRTGSAIGDVYFLGAVGSIVGTFLTGFLLIYLAPTSVIVAIVAASLALLAAWLSEGVAPRLVSLAAAVLLGGGAAAAILDRLELEEITRAGSDRVTSGLIAAGNIAALAMGLLGAAAWWNREREARGQVVRDAGAADESGHRVPLWDLCLLGFLASLAFMALEMVAGRLVTRHLGSSIYGWTSVIGVLLGGLSLGNYLGGKLADRIRGPSQAAGLFLIASAMVLLVLLTEHPPVWMVRNPIAHYFQGAPPDRFRGPEGDLEGSFLSQAPGMVGYPWWFRVLFWTGVVFLVPALTMGTVSPVVAKLAVDRLRSAKRTGTAIGTVYAWGMVGSIVGTFLTGFLLIDVLGTKGVLLAIATTMALAATSLGNTWHAAWAGVPLGLCIIAFGPALLPGPSRGEGAKPFLTNLGVEWGLRERLPDPENEKADVAYLDESNYYFIKVNNERRGQETRRTLVLDNLIHGYIILGRPGRLDYDYEHIYALVTDRAMRARGADEKRELGTLFLGGGSYTFPRYLQATYPRTWAEVAEIDPAVTRANHAALGLLKAEPAWPEPRVDAAKGTASVTIQGRAVELGDAGDPDLKTRYVAALQEVAPAYQRDTQANTAFVVLDGQRHDLGEYGSAASHDAYVAAVRPWFESSKYRIRTTWGDARQYAVKNQGRQRFNVVYGDAFNDFSVPWHLTTLEFNRLIDAMLTDDGIYMINIIDVFESDAHAAQSAPEDAMARAVERVLAGRWSGVKPVDKVAADLVSTLTLPEQRVAWARMSGWAQRGLRHLHGRRSVAEIAEAIVMQGRLEAAASRCASAGVAEIAARRGGDDERAGKAEQLLAIARNEDVIAAWKAMYREAESRFAREEAAGPTAGIMGLAFDRLGPNEDRLAAWHEEATRVLKGIKTAADSLGAYRTDGVSSMAEALERAGNDLLERAKKDELEIDAARFALDALEALRLEFQGRIEQASGDALLQKSLLDDSVAVLDAAREAVLGLRLTLADRLDRIKDAAEADPPLARDVAAAVERELARPEGFTPTVAEAIARARTTGGFLGAWVNTARSTFPNVYVFGTDEERGRGVRETFVVVASRKPLDLAELGRRPDDPQFFTNRRRTEPEPFGPDEMEALEIRGRGIVLTDDYAPVENLLAPVAATRAKD
jgi:MFS family permease/spermidine synthase